MLVQTSDPPPPTHTHIYIYVDYYVGFAGHDPSFPGHANQMPTEQASQTAGSAHCGNSILFMRRGRMCARHAGDGQRMKIKLNWAHSLQDTHFHGHFTSRYYSVVSNMKYRILAATAHLRLIAHPAVWALSQFQI